MLPATSRTFSPWVLVLALALGWPALAPGQITPDQQAQMLLDSAKRAYNERNYPFATARFREYLMRFGGHRDANAARYGLALCLLEGTERDPEKAMEQLNPLLGQKTFAEHPQALYYAGVARRTQGVKALEQAVAKPAEAPTHQAVARQRFEEASRHFGEAATTFLARMKEAKPGEKEKGLSEDLEWALRSRCDQAEMLLRGQKAKEARDAVASFTTDKDWQKSKYLNLGLYYHGFASFLLGELTDAGRSLGRTAVLSDEIFGTHARYLLGRVYHLNPKQAEREEARQAYQAVLKDHEAAKVAGQAKLGQQIDVDTRARLERLVRGPAPDHVARAAFFLGVLQYEDGRFNDAAEQFKAFAARFPEGPLGVEARLRLGFCQVQMKQFDDAMKTLTPLAEKEPAVADQALYYLARAQLGKADPAKPDTVKPGLDTFRRAAERANQRAAANPPDPRAKTRRGEILADLAEALQGIKQYREAVNTYNGILQEKLLPAREDELLLSLATAQQLDNDLGESEKTCARFLERFKDSVLAPAVLFRQAENSALQAIKAEKLPDPATRTRETAKFNDEAIKRYAALVEKYPEYAHVPLARHGLGLAHYRKGDLEAAQKALEAIPPADRNGELALVSYTLADIYLRQLPSRADDAVTAGRMEEKLKAAAEQLDAFLGAAPENPQVPDALLKLGYCHQRSAKLLANVEEQRKSLAAARSAYERVQQKYRTTPAFAQASFERAKVLAAANEVGPAQEELKKFNADETLKKAPIAPMALLYLATLQRGQNRAADAVVTLAECRKNHEPGLTGERAPWAVLLQYHHAAALREAGKLEEARQLFDQVARNDRPEGWDAALRAGQVQKEAGEKKLAEGKKQLAASGQNAMQRAAAEKLLSEGAQDLRNAVAYLVAQEQALRGRKPATDELQKQLAQTRARMLYESAWGWRQVADLEVEDARRRVQQERWQKRRDELARLTPPGQTPPMVPMPEVALADVPVQPAEGQVRARYQELIKTFPELALNADARFELAEVLSQRGEGNEAVKLLQGALEGEKEPAPELTERIKLRLGTCLLDRGTRKGLEASRKLAMPELKPADKAEAEKLAAEGRKDIDAALEQLQPITGNEKSPLLAQASYRESECLLQQGKLDEAIKLLTKFRDHGPFQNVPGLSDRALLRLGWALGEKKQWDASRQAYETLLGRFGASPWRHEARYGIGWAYQGQGQYEPAANTYAQVTGEVATELGARAQLNIGLCRMMQKRYSDAGTALLVVPFTYDYPELSALALLEAARAFAENKQNDQAVKLLRRVVRDHAGSAQAEAARKKLAELGDS
ncbi:MAG: tetratricopeptide repeat protein [Gemmataceae bacterium]